MPRRVFLLGLDGGSWNVFDHLFAQGVMPNLARLCIEGTRGVLESTTPPVTPVAWTSLMTGANPGKHGIFAFRKADPDNSYLPLPVNRMDMKVPTIFDYYREDPGFISLNLPMSFPATEISGKMITGMMTPQADSAQSSHPGDLLEKIAAAGLDYVIDPKLEENLTEDPVDLFGGWKEAPEEILARLGRITKTRLDTVEHFLDSQDWSVFICVVVGTDRIQHMFWDDIFPADGGPTSDRVKRYYAELDDHIGRLMVSLDPEDALLVVSDHGFVKTHGSFQTNEWLKRGGWLKKREVKQSPLYPLKLFLNKLGITRAKLGKVLSADQSSKLQLMASHIDWAKSQAFLCGPFAIRVNLKARETQGMVDPAGFNPLVDEIIAGLFEIKDEQGEPMIAHVVKGADIYHGEGGGQPGDIVFTFRDDLNYTAYAAELGGDIFDRDISKQGDHRVDGIFAAWGGGIASLENELRLSICDILPTVMHLNGRAVPTVCDGRVISETLSDDHEIQRESDWRQYLGESQTVTYTKSQESEINARLRALGYLDDD